MTCNIVLIVAGVHRAEIQLQPRSIELEGRAAADRGSHRSRSIAVRFVLGVSTIIAVAIGVFVILTQLRQGLRAGSLVGRISIPSALVSCEALFIVDCGGGNQTDCQSCRIMAAVSKLCTESLNSFQRLVGHIDDIPAVIFIHCARRTIAQFAIKYCNSGHFLRVLNTEAADRNSYREAEINNIHRFQFSLVYREVESHCLSICGNISLNIFVETTLVLRRHTRNRGNVFIKGLVNTRAVRNISVIVQLENARMDVLIIVPQCCQERRHFATSHILHRNVVIGNDLTIGIIIIDDLKVGFLFRRLQVNQDKLGSIFRAPSDITVLTVDHGRRACVCDFVPHGRLVVPLRPSIGRNLFPCDGVRSIPHICSGVALAVTIRYRDLGDRVVRVISRRDDANVAVSPVVEDRCGFGIHVSLDWGNRAVRVDNCNRQCDLTHAAGSIRRSASCTIAPVLDVGFNFFRDFRLLQIIGDRLVRAQEIMPSASHVLVLPCTGVIAHMGKGRAVSSLVIARSIRLFVVFIQTHGLPIIDSYRIVI